MALITTLFILLVNSLAALPDRPVDPLHPASNTYAFEADYQKITLMNRQVELFLPRGSDTPVPVIVFGHGQALNSSHYRLTFEHLARKGVAVIFPMYDQNFFDQNWQRMAKDYQRLTNMVLKQYSDVLNKDQVIYSGHSKGAYVALLAATLEQQPLSPVASLVLFTPADVDGEALTNLDPAVPLTIIRGQEDRIIRRNISQSIYDLAPNQYKQFIEVVSYPDARANHFFLVTRRTVFGGFRQAHPFHFFGSWKWLMGAALDLTEGPPITNPYLYGAKAKTTGVVGLEHSIVRSW